MPPLVSPGVQVSVTDESAYVSSDAGTVPLIAVASATNKVQGSGAGTAAGTTKANANNTYLMTSQRELVNTFGVPTFYQSTSGTMLHGYELNEYGLQAAYSYLGIANRAYIIRADVDLSELTATSVVPTGPAVHGTYWLDTETSVWGLHTWDADTQSFTYVVPKIVSDSSDHIDGVPKVAFGSIGDYAVVTDTLENEVYYKNSLNKWVVVGGGTGATATLSPHAGAIANDTWASSWPTVTGTVTVDATIPPGNSFKINDVTITAVAAVPAAVSPPTPAILATNTLARVAVLINKAFDGLSNIKTGVSADVIDNKLVLTAVGSARNTDASTLGSVTISTDGGVNPTAFLTKIGLTAGVYRIPGMQQSSYTDVPLWQTSESETRRPSGSVWQKLQEKNNGLNLSLKLYTATTAKFTTVSVLPVDTIAAATTTLGGTDPRSIAVGSIVADHDFESNGNMSLKLWRRNVNTETVITGSLAPTLEDGDKCTINSKLVTVAGTTASKFVEAVGSANVPNVIAKIEATGAISLVHALGGDIILSDGAGAPLADMGITANTSNVYAYGTGVLIGTNWGELSYEANSAIPSRAPDNNQLWYDSALTADIMIHTGASGWRGYKNTMTDFRGWDLSATNSTGPIFAATKPRKQTDGIADLVKGDIWIDTSDLENYPRIYRYDDPETEKWTLLDNSDQTTSNGVLFADARWNTSDDAKVSGEGAGTPSSIVSLLTNDFLDPDAPNPALYPTGTILWNTRRSGFNVKEYKSNVVTRDIYPADNPRYGAVVEGLFVSDPVGADGSAYYPDRWVSKAGNQDNGAGYFGRKSQRRVIVAAMKSAIDTSTDLREEQRQFNLIAAPGYPELMSNLVTLNVDRKETGHIIGDPPFRLSADAANLQAWSKNSNAATDNGEDGLVTNNAFMSVYYPSGQTNDLNGNAIVVPASHMILRTFAYNDSVSYPWFAAAGTNRGKITNANSIGYIDSASGEFQSIAVREGLRDVLYTDNINPITFINGSGLMNFGNKTRASTSSAIDRVNVARLVSHMRRVLDLIAKAFIFEPNDELTRSEIKGVMESFCNDLSAKRALSDYLVVCDESNNTPARIDRSELYVDIAIEPVKSVEFIFIPIRLKNTGEISSL